MDAIKAHKLLLKIQSILDDGTGQDISRLEKDLLKSYILQLYDAVSFEEPPVPSLKAPQPPLAGEEAGPGKPAFPAEPEPARTTTGFARAEKQPEPVPVEIRIPAPEPVMKAETVESWTPPAVMVEQPAPKETVRPVAIPAAADEALAALFDLPQKDKMSGGYSHVPVSSIESALGLNERIFTLNDLFNGDKGLFDATCARLNQLTSFADATAELLNGPAKQFNWAHPEKVKMAEQFIRIVARRYPKP